MSIDVGIDLGTTNSLVSIVENGKPLILARGEEKLVPSVVGVTEDGRIIVGHEALNQLVIAPDRTVRSIKRKMGNDEKVNLGDRQYYPEEISAFILRYLKDMAEEVLKDKVNRAVITVPAYFNDAQRHATKRAGELAGLEVLRIINEPTAAALAYGIEKKDSQFFMIYDLGGGTFDVSIIEQVDDILEVRASHGNVMLGGDDFDHRLRQRLINSLSTNHRYDFNEDRRAMASLWRAAEKTKIALSSAPFAKAREEFLAQYDGNIIHLDTEVSRDEFEELIGDLLNSTIESVDKALDDAQLKSSDIQRILLVGGSSRIPQISTMLRDHVGIEPAMEINPDEAVALGAAIQAAIINGTKVDAMLVDVAPHSLGISTAEIIFGNIIPGRYQPIIPRNTTIPTTKAECFYTITPRQDIVEIEVYQGESHVAVENSLLGKFKFTDIPPHQQPDKNREFIVEFSYNLDGIVEVTAADRTGQRKEHMTVNALTAKRKTSQPEIKKRFDDKLERDIKRSLESSATLALTLESDGKIKEAQKLRKARIALEKTLQGENEKQVIDKLSKLDDMLYDLEDISSYL